MYDCFAVDVCAKKECILQVDKMKLQMMNRRQYFLTLPNAIIRAKGWSKGDSIKCVVDGKGDLVLRKE